MINDRMVVEVSMITGATIISNNVSVKHMPEAGQDAQQTLNITPTHVTLTRYILD